MTVPFSPPIGLRLPGHSPPAAPGPNGPPGKTLPSPPPIEGTPPPAPPAADPGLSEVSMPLPPEPPGVT